MAAEATFRHGKPTMIDYTPSSGNVTGGAVLVQANTGLGVLIAHDDIANNVRGAVSSGGGIYEVTSLTNSANNAKVYWDDTNNKVTTTAGANAEFGYVVRDGGGGVNTNCLVQHFSFQ